MTKSPAERWIEQVPMTAIEGASPGNDPSIPYATHSGVLDIGFAELKVYQLSNGMRVIDQNDFHLAFGDLPLEVLAQMGNDPTEGIL